jgi:hypothetical protein
MTMAHILDEGVPSFSFRLEGVEQVVPYDIRELLGFQKGSPGTSGCARRHMGRFLEYDRGRSVATKKYYPDPIIQVCNFVVQVDFWGE